MNYTTLLVLLTLLLLATAWGDWHLTRLVQKKQGSRFKELNPVARRFGLALTKIVLMAFLIILAWIITPLLGHGDQAHWVLVIGIAVNLFAVMWNWDLLDE